VRLKSILASYVRLATGEVFGRLATFVLFVYVSRMYGVAMLGVLALAQTVASFLLEFSDQGFRLIGARVVARNAAIVDFVVAFVVKRRVALAAIAMLLGAVYAMFGPVPTAARLCVLLFSFTVLPYALTLDWVAWGLGKFGVMAIWRSGVSILYVVLAIAGMYVTVYPVAAIGGANLASAAAGAGFLWVLYRVRWRRPTSVLPPQILEATRAELRPSRVFSLGLANVLNMVFMNADILLLGMMTSTREVGRYGAACKPLYIIFTGFWLLTDALYPHLAKLEASLRAQRMLLVSLLVLAVAAAAIAFSLGLLAPQILRVIYGSSLDAERLFRILLIALPIDFCFSLLWTVLVSRGYERAVLYSLATAAGVNVVSNIWLIPKFQAYAAAWTTVGSYALLFSLLLVFVLWKRVLAENPELPSIGAVVA